MGKAEPGRNPGELPLGRKGKQEAAKETDGPRERRLANRRQGSLKLRRTLPRKG